MHAQVKYALCLTRFTSGPCGHPIAGKLAERYQIVMRALAISFEAPIFAFAPISITLPYAFVRACTSEIRTLSRAVY